MAAVDVNGDGHDEIITGVGGSGNPLIRMFNTSGQQMATEFEGYPIKYKNGVTLAAGLFVL